MGPYFIVTGPGVHALACAIPCSSQSRGSLLSSAQLTNRKLRPREVTKLLVESHTDGVAGQGFEPMPIRLQSYLAHTETPPRLGDPDTIGCLTLHTLPQTKQIENNILSGSNASEHLKWCDLSLPP